MRWLVAIAPVLIVLALGALWWSRSGQAARGDHSQPVAEDRSGAGTGNGPGTGRTPTGRTLLVRVVDAANGAALSAAAVTAAADGGAAVTAVTGGDGTVTLAPFSGEILAQRRGYAPARTHVGSRSSEVSLRLRAGVVVGGRAVVAGSGAPIEGAAVVATDIDACEVVAELRTDRAGRFEVPGVRPDSPILIVGEHKGFAPVGHVGRRAVAGEEIVLEFGGDAVIEGCVVREDGTAASGAEVVVAPRGGERLFPGGFYCEGPDYVVRAVANADGIFRVAGLRVPAAYCVTAADDRLATGRVDDIELRSGGGRASPTLVLAPRTVVVVRADFPPGEPVGIPEVTLTRDGPGRARIEPIEGHADTFELKEAGLHEVVVRAGNFPVARVPLDVREGARNDVAVRMSRDGCRVLSGRVVDEAGDPIPSAWVRLTTPHGRVETLTAADGRFHLCDVEGAGDLEVSALDHATRTFEDVGPGTPALHVKLRVEAWYTGRFDPVPRSVSLQIDEFANMSHGSPSPLTQILLAPDGRFLVPCSAGRGTSLVFVPEECASLILWPPTLVAGEVHDLGVLRPGPGHDVEGTVRDDRGNPIEDARVVVEILATPHTTTVYTGADGRFRLQQLPDLDRTCLFVEVSAIGFATRTIDPWARPLTGGDPRLGEITLVPAGIVEGIVLDGEGRPDAGALVVAGGAEDGIWTRADSLGRFRAHAAPGAYDFRFLDAGHRPVLVRSGETTWLTLRPSGR